MRNTLIDILEWKEKGIYEYDTNLFTVKENSLYKKTLTNGRFELSEVPTDTLKDLKEATLVAIYLNPKEIAEELYRISGLLAEEDISKESAKELSLIANSIGILGEDDFI